MQRRLLAILAGFFFMAAPAAAEAPATGSMADGNLFYLDNGQKLAVEDLKGMVVVVTYWAADCTPCDDQVKLVDHFARNMKDVGLVPLLVSVDTAPAAEVRAAARGTRLFPVRSVKGWLGPMNAAPTTYVIDRRGKVRYAGTGVMTLAALNEVLLPVIREPQPPM